MTQWEFVARSADVADEGPYHVSAAGTDAVLVRVDGELRAFEGLCPHQGALLGEGELVNGQLVCRNHRWCFDTETGKRVSGPECLQRYPLRESNGRIELDLSVVEQEDQTGQYISYDDLDGPGAFSVAKSVVGGLQKVHIWWEDQFDRYGDTYRLKLGGAPFIVTRDIDAITGKAGHGRR